MDGAGAARRRAVAAVLAGAIAACGPSESAPPASGPGDTAAPLSSLTLDVDGDGKVTSHSDALLILRYTSGIRGKPLVEGAVSSDCEDRKSVV